MLFCPAAVASSPVGGSQQRCHLLLSRSELLQRASSPPHTEDHFKKRQCNFQVRAAHMRGASEQVPRA